jgi:hypothetical protein
MISALGYNSVKANLFTVAPNMAAFFTVLIVIYLSDRFRMRGIFVLCSATAAIGGYIMIIASNQPLIQYGRTFFAAAGIWPNASIVLGWLANNTAPYYVRSQHLPSK